MHSQELVMILHAVSSFILAVATLVKVFRVSVRLKRVEVIVENGSSKQ